MEARTTIEFGAHRIVEDRHLISTGIFRLVQRRIGKSHEVIGGRVLGEPDQASAHADSDLAVLNQKWIGEYRKYPLPKFF